MSGLRHRRKRLVALTTLFCVAQVLAPRALAQRFDASFESGNLLSATDTGDDHFALALRPDTASTQRQWFYFSVADAAGRTLTFDLGPFDISSPWQSGMTPCVTTNPQDPDAWSRVAPAATSFDSGTLTFSWTFAGDEPVWFAYSFAYPFSRLSALMEELAISPHARVTVAGHSLRGRPLHEMEITEGNEPNKVGIWVQGRQHPAECGGSWACEGFLRWVIGPTDEARALRQHAVVRVMPMVNPDGVHAGNYRTNVRGLDLNRQWAAPNEETSVEVVVALEEVARLHADCGLTTFVDLHTHSSILRNWVYGVKGSAAFDRSERGYARALEAVERDFSYSLSSFTNGPSDGIAKNRIHQLYPEVLSYTLEQTYHVLEYGARSDEPITIERYARMGVAVGEALVVFNKWTPSRDAPRRARVGGRERAETPRPAGEFQSRLTARDPAKQRLFVRAPQRVALASQ